jgi:hypothetical protein
MSRASQGNFVDNAVAIEDVPEVFAREPYGRYLIDEIWADPSPPGHTSRS